MASTSEASPLSPDWVFSFNSNAHSCADLGWFSDYTPFPSKAIDHLNNEVQVMGIGTVELTVKKSPFMTGKRAHSILRLTDVFYVPDAEVNIIGQPILKQYPDTTIDYSKEKAPGCIRAADGRPVAYMTLNDNGLLLLRLSGPPVGPEVTKSKLEPGKDYVFRISWPDRERRRWEDFQAFKDACKNRDLPALSSALVPPQPDLRGPINMSFEVYSPSKMQWLKDHHPDAYAFLVDHGLHIFKDEYREKGHALLCALMGREDEQRGDSGNDYHSGEGPECDDHEEEEYGDDESDRDYKEYLQREGRGVEQMLSDAELDSIEERFGSVSEYMAIHGLDSTMINSAVGRHVPVTSSR
ncbi:hypothetical protein F5Y06DRAFT_275891 [Hypoxylon sp. FL0890]|nr:hypothetical protein F5Y06DRAFT_275891 [Hypoxylon sp. FL0890]